MDIVRSLELESFILTKLTKSSVHVNLVGPQVSLPLYWVSDSRGVFIFLCVIRRHFLACEDIAGGSDLSAMGTFFSRNTVARAMGHNSQGGNTFSTKYWWPVRWVPAIRWRNLYFARNMEAFPCVRPWTQLSASPRTVHFRWMSFVDHAVPRAPRRWTTARPRKGTTWSRGRRDSGCPRGEEYEGSLVQLQCEAAVVIGPS